MGRRGILFLTLAACTAVPPPPPTSVTVRDALASIEADVLVRQVQGYPSRTPLADGLAQCGEAGASFLIAALDHDDEGVRSSGLHALAQMPSLPDGAVPKMIATIERATWDHGGLAIQLVAHISEPAIKAYLMRAASGMAKLPRGHAYTCLSRAGPDEETAPLMIAALEDADGWVRQCAFEVLAPQESFAWGSSSDFDRGPRVWEAFWKDARLASERREALRRLAVALDDADPWYRSRAANRLAAGGSDAVPWIPRLLERLADSDEGVRWTATETLAQLAENGVIPPARLIDTLRSDDDRVVSIGADVLGEAGVAAAGPPLMRAFHHDWPLWGPRRQAAIALVGVGVETDEVIAYLAHEYACGGDQVPDRHGEPGAIERVLRKSSRAIEVLGDVARGDRDAPVSDDRTLERPEALRALGALTNRREEALDILRPAATDGPWAWRYSAIESMHKLGASREELVPLLVSMTREGYWRHRQRSAELLLKVAPEPDVLADVFERGLIEGGLAENVCRYVLGGERPATGPLVSSLLRLIESRKEPAVWAALGALNSLDASGDEYRMALLECLRLPRWRDENILCQAIHGLARVCHPDDVDVLLSAIWDLQLAGRSPDWYWRVLARNDIARDAVVEGLRKLFLDPERRSFAAMALADVAPKDERTRDVLIECLAGDDEGLRDKAAACLVEHDHVDAIPHVLRRVLPSALCRMGPKLMGLVWASLESEEDRRAITSGLGRMLLMPTDPDAAVVALGEMGESARSAIPGLDAMIADAACPPEGRARAKRALSAITATR